jgi:hypothetical protein
VGLLFFYSSFGLYSMQSFSWIVTIVAHVLHIGGYIYFMLATGMPPVFGIAQMLFSALTIFYLIMPTTRTLFGH